MKIHIKSMMCQRCIIVVKMILDKMGIEYESVKIGEATINKDLSDEQAIQLKDKLNIVGLEMIDDGKNLLVEKIFGIPEPQTPFRLYLSCQYLFKSRRLNN